MASANPYLMFSGNCEEAFDFYKSVFGGEFEAKSRFDEAPSDQKIREDEGKKIMHISLPLGNGSSLMGSDHPDAYGEALTIGNNIRIAVSPDSEEQATKIFKGLSEGGNVELPMEKTFWGAYFGMVTDKYGIEWMVNYQVEQPK